MPRLTLIDATRSLDRFIVEAKECAQREMGFAAMLTIFPVMLSVSEVETPEENMRPLIRSFVSRVDDYRSWLLHEGTNLNTEDLITLIYELRNGLAHNASTPEGVYLVKSINGLDATQEECRGKKLVGIIEFIRTIEMYVQIMIAERRGAVYDPNRRGSPRGPAERTNIRSLPVSGCRLPPDEE